MAQDLPKRLFLVPGPLARHTDRASGFHLEAFLITKKEGGETPPKAFASVQLAFE